MKKLHPLSGNYIKLLKINLGYLFQIALKHAVTSTNSVEYVKLPVQIEIAGVATALSSRVFREMNCIRLRYGRALKCQT